MPTTTASPPITLPPAQSLRKVYGLRRVDVAIVGSDPDLSFAAMDAPDLMPGGSMMAFDIVEPRVVVERLTRRGRDAALVAGASSAGHREVSP